MTRSEAISRLEHLVAGLESDLEHAQTRAQHLAIAQRIQETREIIRDLATAPAGHTAA